MTYFCSSKAKIQIVSLKFDQRELFKKEILKFNKVCGYHWQMHMQHNDFPHFR